MAKYYVTSGTLRIVIQAEDARSAALWAIHRAMQQVLPEDEARGDTSPTGEQRSAARACMVLADVVELNEIGFERHEAQRFETYDLVTEWSKLMIAVSRMEKELMTAV